MDNSKGSTIGRVLDERGSGKREDCGNQVVKKHLESRMLGNLHVRFGVGAGVELPGLHHLEFLTRPAAIKKRMAV